MNIPAKKKAWASGVLTLLATGAAFFIAHLKRHDFECSVGYGRSEAKLLPCKVSREQNILALSGFRDAPIFTLLNAERASDHRDAQYDVVRRPEGILFQPVEQNPHDAILIFNLDLN